MGRIWLEGEGGGGEGGGRRGGGGRKGEWEETDLKKSMASASDL